MTMRRFLPTIVRRDADSKRRLRLAAMAERAAIPERPFLGRGPRYLIHPHVSIACGAVLSEIAFDLRDESLAVDTGALDPLATFLKGPDSTLFELNVVAAVDETVRISRLLRRRGTSKWARAHEFELADAER
jgi:hypothetical protein